jgi:hypothetical protein
VLIVERFILARLRNRRFLSLGELNEAIREVLGDLNARLMRKLGASRREFFDTIGRPALLPLPPDRYAYAKWCQCRSKFPHRHGRSDPVGVATPRSTTSRRSAT